MKSKIFKFLLSFSICIVLIIASSPFVSAASTVYTIPMNQPRSDDYSGYIEYLLRDIDGSIVPFVTFWHITGSTDDSNGAIGTPSVEITVTNSRILLSCSFISVSSTDKFYFSLVGGTVNGYNSSFYWNYGSGGSNCVNANAYIGSGTVVGYKIYGNFKLSSDSTVNSGSLTWNMSYSETSVLYEVLLLFANSMGAGNQAIIQNATDNTDKLINAGSDKGQPDFGSTNGKLDDTVGQIESIEGSYQIDQAATNTALSTGSSFLQGSDMQRASIQVKTWIERFSFENRVVTGFLIAAMVLGLCFWVIGRKAWSK